MIVIKTIVNDRPVKTRALRHPAHFHRTPSSARATKLEVSRTFFTRPPRPGFQKASQPTAKEPFKKLTK